MFILIIRPILVGLAIGGVLGLILKRLPPVIAIPVLVLAIIAVLVRVIYIHRELARLKRRNDEILDPRRYH